MEVKADLHDFDTVLWYDKKGLCICLEKAHGRKIIKYQKSLDKKIFVQIGRKNEQNYFISW